MNATKIVHEVARDAGCSIREARAAVSAAAKSWRSKGYPLSAEGVENRVVRDAIRAIERD